MNTRPRGPPAIARPAHKSTHARQPRAATAAATCRETDPTLPTRIHRTERILIMPNWSTEPAQPSDGHPLRIVRCPAKGVLTAVITSPGLIGCPTHYVNNRTQPCEGQGKCDWCEAGHSWRWHGWVACILVGTYEHVIFEMTATSSDSFRNYQAIKDTLRGCLFTATRPSQRHNGRVVISCKPADTTRIVIPASVNVRRILCHIWGINYDSSWEDGMRRPPFKHIGVNPGNGDQRQKPLGKIPIP